jgi:dTMP kinase
MRGRFIVIEGLDGVGKSTLVQGVTEALGAVAMDTPGADLSDVRHHVDRFVEGDPEASQLFYAMAVKVMGQRAQRATLRGQTVVMDRYWLTTAAYAEVYGSSLALAEVARRVPCPDLTLYLTLEDAERRRRLQVRGMRPHDERTLEPGVRSSLDRAYRRLLGTPQAGDGRILDLTGLDPHGAILAALACLDERKAA